MNYPEFYKHITAWYRESDKRIHALQISNRIFTYFFYISYPLLLLYLLIQKDPFLIKAFTVPAVSFVIVTVIRKLINRKRPYETYDIDPLIHKNTKGKSMPSRHVFSACVIAMVFLHVNVYIGIIMLISALIGAVIRVSGGVHYPSDVCAGALTGILSGLFLWL